MSSWAKWRRHVATTLAVLSLASGTAVIAVATGPASAAVAASGGSNTHTLSGAVSGTLKDGPTARAAPTGASTTTASSN